MTMSGPMTLFDVAQRAMSAQLVRMNAAASNLANAGSVAGSEGEAYRPLRPVFAEQLDPLLGAVRDGVLPRPAGDLLSRECGEIPAENHDARPVDRQQRDVPASFASGPVVEVAVLGECGDPGGALEQGRGSGWPTRLRCAGHRVGADTFRLRLSAASVSQAG